jgi:hypothetical protein
MGSAGGLDSRHHPISDPLLLLDHREWARAAGGGRGPRSSAMGRQTSLAVDLAAAPPHPHHRPWRSSWPGRPGGHPGPSRVKGHLDQCGRRCFGFRSDPTKTSVSAFAVIGRERNGVFFPD